MRWWLNTDHKTFSVDNASAQGLDFSALAPDIWTVQWTDGRGEIERQDVAQDANLNGLRESFIDVIPYAPLFQQFLRLTPGLLLDQAKKVQIELINTIFDSKRQMPFHYPIAAGDYWWDATDQTLQSSTAAVSNASLNQVISSLNSVVAFYNSNHVSVINQNAGIDNTLVGQINALVNQINGTVVGGINSGIVDPHNNTVVTDNSYGTQLIDYINNTVLNTYGGVVDSVNYALHAQPTGPAGLSADIPHTGIVWANPYNASYVSGVGAVGPGTYNTASPAPYTPIPPAVVGVGADAQWIPIGATAPVTVTSAEQQGIIAGIAARTSQLNLVRNTKNAEVDVLTTITDVINYDVTTGWPATSLPPGFKPYQMMASDTGNRSVAFVGPGGTGGPAAPPLIIADVAPTPLNQTLWFDSVGLSLFVGYNDGTSTQWVPSMPAVAGSAAPGGGIAEAPNDGKAYGRQSTTWQRVIAITNDLFDGGSF